MSWLQRHLEEFIKPVLKIDVYDLKASSYFKSEEVTIIKNAWRSVKRQAKEQNCDTILLAGRDVFIFEILARREDYPTCFLPECSRRTVSQIELLTNKEKIFLFDTGYVGSIPKALAIKKFSLLSSSSNFISFKSVFNNTSNQVFPMLTNSRGLALKIENTPKYWRGGFLGKNNEVCQEYSDFAEFLSAAQLTIEIYTNSSPRFINHAKPISVTKEDKTSWTKIF